MRMYNILLDDIIAHTSRVLHIPDVLVRDCHGRILVEISRHKTITIFNRLVP